MKVLIFAGPSIHGVALECQDNVHIQPPIRRRDLEHIGDHNPIVIIDGEFGQSLSVTPKEILRAIQSGITVIGAGSMGALRASELKDFGMIGVGWVYQRFVTTKIRCDDEVALTYAPLDFEPLSVPLVNIEYWLTLPAFRAVTTSIERSEIRRRNRAIFFSDRAPDVVDLICRDVLGKGRFDRLLSVCGGSLPDIKRIDAVKSIGIAFNLMKASTAVLSRTGDLQ
jgi:TfuA protein